jgi:hypothetical protein
MEGTRIYVDFLAMIMMLSVSLSVKQIDRIYTEYIAVVYFLGF